MLQIGFGGQLAYAANPRSVRTAACKWFSGGRSDVLRQQFVCVGDVPWSHRGEVLLACL